MFKNQKIKDLENKIYEKIATEIDADNIQKGLWVKAKAKVGGDKSRIESEYIKLRFEELKEKSLADYNKRLNAEYAERKEEEGEKSKLQAAKLEEEKMNKKWELASQRFYGFSVS